MIATMPELYPEGRYNAKQTASLLGISRETLRKWVNAGKIRQRISKASGRPRYLGSDILMLWKAEKIGY